MSHAVAFEPTAFLELNEAADFYDLERPGLGTEFFDAVEAALTVVADTPAAFPIELGETRKRVITRFPYSVMYWFDGATVHVSAIAHHRQRPRYWGDRP
ncbi:MAG: type II toxin-antitoxin system RelE/ParE family toxin [Actinobacteria bacterium]|nr:type II toxin-antitoxin system RelE/ParE family toxin [Actinomycetota bacterium]